MPIGTNQGRYIVEADGFPVIRAMSFSGGAINHTPTLLNEGARSAPHVLRGNHEIDELTIKQGSALNDVGFNFFRWIDDFVRGITNERKTFRLVTLDETFDEAVEVWEYIDCVPTSLAPDDREARGNDPASFTFKVKPSDAVLIE